MAVSNTPKYVVKYNGNEPREVRIENDVDMFYRYTFHQLQYTVVGKRKMMRTAFVNIEDVAKELHTKYEYILCWMGYDIGTSFTAKKSPYLSGEHSSERLSVSLSSFLKQIIVCKGCKLPELSLYVKNKNIKVRCFSCGLRYDLSNLPRKFENFVIKNPPSVRKTSHKRMKRGRTKTKVKDTFPKSNLGDEWSLDLSSESVEHRQNILAPESIRKILLE